MAPTTLTEAEFRAFAEKLEQFARRLTINERGFLTGILVGATVATAVDLPGHQDSSESPIQSNLAYALWQASLAPDRAWARNPLPVERPPLNTP